MINQSSSTPEWIVFSAAVICFSYLWHTKPGLTATLAMKCCIKYSQEIHFRGASSHRCLYTEPKCFSRDSISHCAHATSLHTSSYSAFTAQSFSWKGFVEEQLFAQLTWSPREQQFGFYVDTHKKTCVCWCLLHLPWIWHGSRSVSKWEQNFFTKGDGLSSQEEFTIWAAPLHSCKWKSWAQECHGPDLTNGPWIGLCTLW